MFFKRNTIFSQLCVMFYLKVEYDIYYNDSSKINGACLHSRIIKIAENHGKYHVQFLEYIRVSCVIMFCDSQLCVISSFELNPLRSDEMELKT